MSVKSLIDDIVPQIPNGYNRTGASRSILALIDDAQRELFDYDAPGMRYIDSSNEGMPPYLTTVAGTFRYDITAANLTGVTAITRRLGGTDTVVRARSVIRVFVDASGADYGQRWLGRAQDYSAYNPFTSQISRVGILPVPIESSHALENDPASVTFIEDPGDTTDRYFVDFIWEPARLLSEAVPLSVPKRFELALEDYVIGTIHTRTGGALANRLEHFYGFWVPDFRKTQYVLPNSRLKYTPARIC